MGVCADPGSYRWCQALSRSRSSFATKTTKAKKSNHKTTTATATTTITTKIITKSTTISKATPTYSSYIIETSVSSDDPTQIIHQRTTKNQFNLTTTTTTPKAIGSDRRDAAPGKHQSSFIYASIFQSSQFRKLLQLVLLAFVTIAGATQVNIPEDAVHITAILGEGVIFNCHVEFPNEHPVPYVLQWDKKVSETGSDLPIYIWYESYPEHIEEGYKGRVSRVSPDSPFGSASLNLTNIKESDQGWYECKVVFLNRDPKQHKNGTWFHLDVHAPPRFSVTPEDIIYVNLGDSIILNCQADGTPTPEILWYKDANPVDPSPTVGIFNDGTELRISTIRHEDIGEYTCIARNGEGQVSHTARVIIAGGAVIMVPPTNQTKLEGEKVIFSCEAKAMPGNVTVRWFREGALVHEVASLETRVTIRKDGSLIINPVSADDSGQYLCEVTNGIGDPQSASAYLSIEYPAKVTFTPTVQYLPFRLAGVVQCFIKSNPILQYVTWTKDKRLLEPYQMKDIVVMANGSLLFTRVNEDHQGRYTCTPYNAQGTQGSSGPMEVLVRKPPTFVVEPETLYQRKVGDSVEMHCDAIEAEGTERPTIKWQRQDGELTEPQRNRIRITGGNMTIENLRRDDFGYYQCIVSNEVATLMAITQLVIEGTQPHAPYNITGKATESSITLHWMAGYSGGSEYKQDYTIWYREAGIADWQTISVTPSGSTEITINGLASGTTYEFQVVGRNILGDGMMSKILTVRTLDLLAPFDIYFHTDSNGSIVYSPPKLRLKGPKPGPPRNLTVTEVSNGFLISWQAPLERAHIVKFYTIKYRTDAQWKTLNRGQIRSEETQYLVKNLVGGRTYYFRVLANSEKSYESSDEVKFPVPARVKHKAITAGVVGGILFFIVAIILSVCAVKICNKRKRRKQEKEFNMVACRITDGRNIAANNHNLQRRSTGSLSGGQVPLKKYKQTRISRITAILIAILHWIWPPDRCTNCHSIYSSPNIDDGDASTRRRSLSQIQRSVDGRFVLSTEKTKSNALINGKDKDTKDENDGPLPRRNSQGSQNSSSDDGGFLSRRNFITARASWRRPLVASPSQLSLQSAADSARGFLQGLGSLLRINNQLDGGNAGIAHDEDDGDHDDDDDDDDAAGGGGTSGARYQNVQRTIYRNLMPINEQQTSRPLHINTAAVGTMGHHHQQHGLHHEFVSPNLYTPSKVSRIYSSSPASTTNGVQHLHHHHHHHHLLEGIGMVDDNDVDAGMLSSPWALATPPHHYHSHYLNNFSDLSTVYPSSAERSLPTPAASGNLSRYRYYSHELPSLRTIQEETRRMNEQQQQEQQQHQQHQQQQQQQQHQQQHQSQQQQQTQRQRQHTDQHGFVPLQIPSPPSWRSYYQQQPQTQLPYHSYRPRTRWYPRHYARLFGRTQSELLSPLPHLNLSMRSYGVGNMAGLEASPESRSSSSGFGSKNTSNHPGSTSEWRLLPPYRPPPPAPAPQPATSNSAYFGSPHALTSPASAQPQQAQAQAPTQRNSYSSATLPYYLPSSSGYFHHHHHHHPSLQRPITPPYTMQHWLDMMSRLNAATDSVHLPKSVDVGSVDGHYEFDPSTPTPSASSQNGVLMRDDFNLHIDTTGHHTLGGLASSIFHSNASAPSLSLSSAATFGGLQGRKSRISRYDNIETRLQAMKEEFYAYRKRQAMKRAGVAEMESVC